MPLKHGSMICVWDVHRARGGAFVVWQVMRTTDAAFNVGAGVDNITRMCVVCGVTMWCVGSG